MTRLNFELAITLLGSVMIWLAFMTIQPLNRDHRFYFVFGMLFGGLAGVAVGLVLAYVFGF